MDHQEALGNFGSPCEFEWKGKTFRLSFFTQGQKACLVKLMKQSALKEMLELADDMPERDRQSLLDGHRRDRESGKFSFGSPYCLSLLETEKGLMLLMMSLFYKHPEVTLDDVQEMLADKAKAVELAELIKIHTPKLPQGSASPKA